MIGQSTRAYRRDIDGLRAIAVIAVVIFHAFPNYFHGGFVGVDIFFVISGFLITQIILDEINKGRFRVRDFYSRRIRRIFPSLAVVLVTAILLGWFILLPEDLASFGTLLSGSTVFVINFLLWNQVGYFDTSSIEKPLLHLWSLSIEEQFYLVWPALLIISFKMKRNFLALAGTTALVSLGGAFYCRHNYPDFSFYSPLTRFWELLVGALLAHGFTSSEGFMSKVLVRSKNREIIVSIAGIVLLCAITLGSESRSFLTVALGVFASAGVIAFGAGTKTSVKVIGNPVFVWVGLISYPLYLWHWIFLSYAEIYYGKTPPLSVCAASIGLSVFLSFLCYRFLEIRMRSRTHESRKVITLLAIMVVIGLIGVALQSSHGARSRISSSAANVAQLVRPAASDAVCGEFIKLPNHLFAYCRLSNVGGRQTVAVIGDSHADVSWNGFAKEFSKDGINTLMLANSSCPTFLGTATGSTVIKLNRCASAIEQILRSVDANSSIHSVILITRGAVYLEGGAGFRPWTAKGNSSQNYSALQLRNAFAQGLQATVDDLNSHGKKVFLVSENPELGFEPKNCITTNLWRAKSIENCKTPTRAEVESRQAEHQKILQQVHDAFFVNTLDLFCPEKECFFTKNGLFMYADKDHLSIFGNETLALRVKNFMVLH